MFVLYCVGAYVVMYVLMCFRERNGILGCCKIDLCGRDCYEMKNGEYVLDSDGQLIRKIDIIGTNRALGIFFLLAPITTPITLICLLFINILGLAIRLVESATPNIFSKKSSEVDNLKRQLAELKAKVNNSVEITDGIQ